MKEFSLATLARIINAQIVQPAAADRRRARPDLICTRVSTDSRTIRAGDCFFAVRGKRFDGHDYLREAYERGAVCAVIDRPPGHSTPAGKCLLRVRDTVAALGQLAGQYRKQAGFTVVAITGSVGKTTTRQIVAHVLGRHFRVHQSPRSFNNNIGVPLTLLSADPDDQIVVAELGSNHPGEIAYLTRITLPDIAVVTNVHPAHLEGFGDLAAIVTEKLAISEGLDPGGTLIVNADSAGLVDACGARGLEFVTFGRSETARYRAEDVRCEGLSSRFTIDSVQIRLPLPGTGNVENALAAWAVCSKLGIGIEDFAAAVQSFPPVAMRAEPLNIGTLTVLNDCYNANPASMQNALDILKTLGSQKRRRLVFICGDMAELGRDADRLHASLGASIARAKVKLLIAVGRLARIAAEHATKIADYNLKTECFGDAASACNNLHGLIKDYDIILVKGSRSVGLELAVDRLKELFA